MRVWLWVHRWTSLISTLFLLILCITGLPLIFHAEIDSAFGYRPAAFDVRGKPASIETLVEAGEVATGDIVQFVVWEADKPGIVTLSMAKTIDAEPSANHSLYVDARTAKVIAPRGPMTLIRVLHGQLFLGPFGPLALGLVTCLFLAAIVSGVVVYAPFMRRLPFGAVRFGRSSRIAWLDLHNLLGIAIAGWMMVVAFTGMMNTWGSFVIEIWRSNQLAALTAPYANRSLPIIRYPANTAVAEARRAVPSMQPYFLAYPGTMLTSRRHYAVFMRGSTPLTSRLVTPILVDAVDGRIAAKLELPVYVKAMLLAEPLHFGDYGGLPLKILWALLDSATIFVLTSGLYLWWMKRKNSPSSIKQK